MASPRHGEVWLVDLGMAAKVRPALVISVRAADIDLFPVKNPAGGTTCGISTLER